MKANELMIGDWVDLSEEANETIPCKVVGMMPEELYEIQPNDTACDIVGYDMVRPILITAEILEKNGFICESDGLTWHDGVHNEEQVYVYCPIRKNGNVRKIEICSIRHHFFAELEDEYYVHELQHALRLCGLNELADNFKI